MMDHVILLGDSIFDNALYVPGGESVIQQLRSRLDRGNRGTLLAIDGATVADVPRQLRQLPDDASHLVLSVGGNDALQCFPILNARVSSSAEVFAGLADIQSEFASEYQQLLQLLASTGRPTLVCTVYDAVPDVEREARTALSIFNDVILRSSIALGLPVLDLRFVANERRDYSDVSPIEPSEIGGSKIVRGIVRALKTHDFERRETVVYR